MEQRGEFSKDAVICLMNTLVQTVARTIVAEATDKIESANFVPADRVCLLAGSAAFQAAMTLYLADNDIEGLRDLLKNWIDMIDSGEAQQMADKLREAKLEYDNFVSDEAA